MGKKSKATKSINSTESVNDIQNFPKPDKKKLKSNKVYSDKHSDNENTLETNDIQLEKYSNQIRKRKRKYNTDVDGSENKSSRIENKKKIKDETKTTNKKIIFDDETDQEIPTTSESSTSSKVVNKKTKQFLNDDEAEVEDEDIDKFCNEVTEEDNAQYEDWVKLIEAKLRSNVKKKPT